MFLSKVTNDPNEETFNWVYNTCNGFRDMKPSDIDFLTLKSSLNLIAVSFGHIITLWNYEKDGLTLITDLIHCDPEDYVTHIKMIDHHLLVAHKTCLNLWNLTPVNNKSNDLELESLIKKIRPVCVLSESLGEVLMMVENPLTQSQLLLFIQKNMKKVNDESTTEVQSKLWINA